MSQKRKTDAQNSRDYFRTERLEHAGGKWYFATREGTMEGPYADKDKAMEGLNAYINVVEFRLVEKQIELASDLRLLPTLH